MTVRARDGEKLLSAQTRYQQGNGFSVRLLRQKSTSPLETETCQATAELRGRIAVLDEPSSLKKALTATSKERHSILPCVWHCLLASLLDLSSGQGANLFCFQARLWSSVVRRRMRGSIMARAALTLASQRTGTKAAPPLKVLEPCRTNHRGVLRARSMTP
jgi:hypothetical protein